MQKIIENNLREEIDLLKKGEDWYFRETVSKMIQDIINQSNEGLIGWNDYMQGIKDVLEVTDIIFNKYFKQ